MPRLHLQKFDSPQLPNQPAKYSPTINSCHHDPIKSTRIPYYCSVCEKIFCSAKEFIEHTGTDNPAAVKPHRCNVCNKTFLFGRIPE